MKSKLLITNYYNQVVEIATQYLEQYIATNLAQYKIEVAAETFNQNTEPYCTINDTFLPDIYVSVFDYQDNCIFSATICDQLDIIDKRPAHDFEFIEYLNQIPYLLQNWYQGNYDEVTRQYNQYQAWQNRCIQHLYQMQNQLNQAIIDKNLTKQVSTYMLIDEAGPLLMLKGFNKQDHNYLQAMVTMDVYGTIEYPEIDIDEDELVEFDIDNWLEQIDLSETFDAISLSQLRATELVKF